MTSSEKLHLQWNDFQQNIAESYHILRDDPYFSDVTLVCEEDQYIESHRIILTAGSQFFNTMLKKNNHSHPMIYMRGIRAKDMLAVVDYIYSGETKIYQENLDGFLALAVELKLKGLDKAGTEYMTLDNIDDHTKRAGQQIIKPIAKQEHNYKIDNYEANHDLTRIKVSNNSKVPVHMDKLHVAADISMEDLKLKLDFLMERVNDGLYSWKCTVCGKGTKESSRQNMRKHIETHIQGLSYPCSQCAIISRSSHAFIMHVSRHHKK